MPNSAPRNESRADDDMVEISRSELNELLAYREKQQRCRGDLSLWLLEVEQAEQRFKMLLERLRRALTA